MKHSLLFVLSLLAALAIGYFAGFKHGHALWSSEQPPAILQPTSTNSGWVSFTESMHNEDQMTTALSFYSFRRLERGEVQPTEDFLASRIAYFYLSYGPVDHPREQLDDAGRELLQAIHDFSQTNAVLQAALKKRAEDFSK